VASLRTEAVVLRVRDFGESDRIVQLLTPAAGRVAAIAKGARRSQRRFPGTLDLFCHVRCDLDRRGPERLARLDQAALLDAFPGLREQAARFGMACYLVELLGRLAPEGGAPPDAARLFRFALGALRALEGVRLDARLRVLLELRALDALGLRPELRACVRCGREAQAVPGGVAFLVGEGGPACAECARARDVVLPVQLGTLRALEGALGLELARLPRLALGAAALAEARHLLAQLHRFHLGLELRSDRFLDEILRPAGGAPARAPQLAEPRPVLGVVAGAAAPLARD
jgi:DNA repair protein RecO (recombination protein O)